MDPDDPIVLPTYHVQVPFTEQERKDESDVRLVAKAFPKCEAAMRARLKCERTIGRQRADMCDALYGPPLAWCIVSSTCPLEAKELKRCQGYAPDTMEKDVLSSVRCKYPEWKLQRCLDRQQPQAPSQVQARSS
eukprot:NODE_5329_length_956_cov_125.136855_g5114_i0.p1 GENE.NODE_5329_length_956_cov_125.136855_g5114_i0~~NODE_5329_length_956_cov_125.136855_g5114_i0.p1  ORF type:complete len:155 (-),score=22.76 NODE_5329_length_956_cov_125.136855_g5114_i0:491-892(-)